MAAAPALQTLLDIESEVERAFTSYLAATLQIPAIGSDTAETQQSPRIEVVAIVVEQGPHAVFIPSGTYAGRKVFDQNRVRIEMALIYSPEFGQNQGDLRGRMRVALTDPAGINAQFATNGYLQMAADSLRQTDGSRAINDREKTETLIVAIEPVFFINPAAWPA